MNWKKHIFKPDWQHRDDERRLQAVIHSNDPQLREALTRIMVEDESIPVRMAAARRIADIGQLEQAKAASDDEVYSKFLRQRIEDLVCSPEGKHPTMPQRRAYVEQSDERQFLERMASEAEPAELRLLALSRIDRQGFLGDRAIHDPDPEIRRTAAAAIKRHATLKRVIEETRTRDKALHSALQHRLKTELLEAGEAAAVGAEALEICKLLEAYAVMHQHQEATVPEDLESRWQHIATQVPDELKQRRDRAVIRIESAAQQAPAEATDEAIEPTPITRDKEPGGEPTSQSAGPDTAQVDPRIAEFRAALDSMSQLADSELRAGRVAALGKQLAALAPESRAEFTEAITSLERRFEAHQQAIEEKASKATALFESYRGLLEDGALHKALEVRQEIRTMAETLKQDGRWKSLNRQMTSLHGRLKELRDWQHWSNDKLRKDLIKQMELLPRADLHPDALLSRIRSLQERWKELERSEQIPGDPHFAAAPWMWRKFQVAGNAAFEAAKPFLDKRSEIQKKREQQSLEVATRLKSLAALEQPDWDALRNGMNKAREHLRELDSLPHKSRKKAANALRKALSTGNDRMQQHYEEVEKEKRKLIRSAEQLVHLEDRKEAIDQAKRLQADWKRAGALWRGRENALWKEFRKPLDPLFEDLEQEHKARQEALKAHLDGQKSLVREMTAILETDDAELEEHRGKVQGLVDRWREIEHPDRKLRARFDGQLKDFEQRLESFKGRLERDQRQCWWDKAALLHELESGLLKAVPSEKVAGALRKRWPQEQVESDLDQELNARFEAALDANECLQYEQTSADRARQLCIQLEFLAGLASPEADREARMQYQVERLSRSMTGDLKRQSAVEEAHEAEREWLTLAVLKPREYARYGKRIRAALEQIIEINNA